MIDVQIVKVEQVGTDWVRLRSGNTDVRVNFADDGQITKEDSAGFLGRFLGKPVAIPNPNETDRGFFIAVDFWRGLDNNLRAMPLEFAISTVEAFASQEK